MTTTDFHQGHTRAPDVHPQATVLPRESLEVRPAIPHDCEPETVPTDPATKTARIIGIDIARALAVVGMIAVHVMADSSDDGAMSIAFVLSAGKSSALFAVLAGLGIALSTGREHRPRGRRWASSTVELVVRAVLIGLIGLVLGAIIPAASASIILTYYGVLFLLAIPLLRLSPGALAVLALVLAVGMPMLSHWLRSLLPVAEVVNLSPGMFLSDPAGSLQMLLLTGEFPALTWVAYLAAGLAIGRAGIEGRSMMMLIAVLGAALAMVANAVSWFVMELLGGVDQLAQVASKTMSLTDFSDFLVWGGDGVTRTDSLLWLAVLAPHTGTPVDILYTMGVAVAVLGVSMILGVVAPQALRPVAAFGSMPLTLYTLHLLLLATPFTPEDGGWAILLHLVILSLVVICLRKISQRGPLEQGIAFVARKVRRLVIGYTPARAIVDQ